jgi:hypothetical protein
VVLSYDGLCLDQSGKPPLNFKMFVSSNAFDNSTFFYKQLKFTWLAWVVIAIEFGGEIDAASRYPIPFYDTLIWRISPVLPAFQTFKLCDVCQRIGHFSLLFLYSKGITDRDHSCDDDGTVGSITLKVPRGDPVD